MTIQALIQAAGSGIRLGQGPKAFVKLDGRTLLERCVDVVLDVAASAIVAVPAGTVETARGLVGDDRVRFIEGGSSRSGTTRLLFDAATADWLVLHDVVHPFATAALVRDLLDAAYTHRASAPGLANTEYIYDRQGNALFAPGEVLVGQKPVALSRDAVLEAYRQFEGRAIEPEPSLMQILEMAGIRTKFVPGSAHNIKITSRADLEFAEATIALARARAASRKD